MSVKDIRAWLDSPENQKFILEVKKLNLSYSFNTIPPEIGKFTELKSLYMEYNAITFLPKEIGNLKKLEILKLSGNKKLILSKEIGNLTNLKELHPFFYEIEPPKDCTAS